MYLDEKKKKKLKIWKRLWFIWGQVEEQQLDWDFFFGRNLRKKVCFFI